MQLSDQQIQKYQMLYKNHFGLEISRKDALEQGLKLINLVRIVAKNYKN